MFDLPGSCKTVHHRHLYIHQDQTRTFTVPQNVGGFLTILGLPMGMLPTLWLFDQNPSQTA
jgi:hypothetical protein